MTRKCFDSPQPTLIRKISRCQRVNFCVVFAGKQQNSQDSWDPFNLVYRDSKMWRALALRQIVKLGFVQFNSIQFFYHKIPKDTTTVMTKTKSLHLSCSFKLHRDSSDSLNYRPILLQSNSKDRPFQAKRKICSRVRCWRSPWNVTLSRNVPKRVMNAYRWCFA